ncbi:MAG: CPBP family intramembrane glutamic endopeptidase [Candidatus Lokiarchaeia archaeon]|nr:CPBP family intramembrane glutamic endopeptidase [Candidatus Lokiarchaeia archaeon]
MEYSGKYVIIAVISFFLFIPMIFGVYIQYTSITVLDPFFILPFLLGLVALIILGKFIEIFIFNNENIELMRNHDVMNALINKNNRIVIYLFFPLTMIMEELIFRYYLIGFLSISLNFDEISVILISSVVFSLYHIHTWFSFKNLTILLINLVYPFLMGLYLGYIFLNLGILPCILIHYILAFFLYYSLYRRYFKA